MATSVSYPLEVKMKAIQSRLAGVSVLVGRKQTINHKRVQRLYRRRAAVRVRMKKRKSTGQPVQSREHQLKCQLEADTHMQKLVTDITYLPFGRRTLYLSSILDLYNSEIIAYRFETFYLKGLTYTTTDCQTKCDSSSAKDS